ncbi:uncharacterized protein LOC126828280 [Patella vulgata]|uniref:uncharacterized protein LOC126828280 n=1 Tax=Patella vulgata TaxID=6465 RepID=UPI0021803A40|nr:uncharacterized protein LOC126828280 [Patella vulgata]
MLDVPLSFPFPYIRSASRCRYADIPLNPGIPDIDLNIQVLSQSNGTVCICYQHLLQARKSEKPPEEKDDIFDIDYYICMVHHAKTLHGCVNGLRKSVIKNKRVHFQWCGGYLGVLLPGVFLHLLNVTIDYEPCHHMLLHSGLNELELVTSTSSLSNPGDNSRSNETSLDTDIQSLQDDRRVLSPDHTSSLDTSPLTLSMSSTLPEEDNESSITTSSLPIIMSVMSENSLTIRSLTSCFGFTRESSGSNLVYDQRSGIVWKISLNPETLLKYFQRASWPTRLAILHYVLTRTKDFFYVKKASILT